MKATMGLYRARTFDLFASSVRIIERMEGFDHAYPRRMPLRWGAI